MADSTLSRSIATTQLKTLHVNRDKIKLIVDFTTIENKVKNNTWQMLNFHGLHSLIDANYLHEAKHPDFRMHKRKKFTCNHLRSSPVRIKALGEFCIIFFSMPKLQLQ